MIHYSWIIQLFGNQHKISYYLISQFMSYEAGMPREAIQFVPGDPTLFVDKITQSQDLNGSSIYRK